LNMLMLVQTVLGYSSLKRFFNYFHFFRLSGRRRVSAPPLLLDEMVGLLWILLAIIAAGAAINFVIYVRFAGFEGKALIPSPAPTESPSVGRFGTLLAIFFQMIYLTVQIITTLGFGDIIPVHIGGQAAVLLVQFQGFVLLTVVLTILSNELAKGTDRG